MSAATPGQAKRLGSRCPIQPRWDEIKDDVMLELVHKKFRQPDLGKKLIATGDAPLYEGNHWGDNYWGMIQVGGEWRGQNKLGKILMQVRRELQEVASDTH